MRDSSRGTIESEVLQLWSITMRIGTTFVLLLTFGSNFALAQPHRQNLYTRPTVPTSDALRRLNLKLNWETRLPMASKRDGVVSCQFAWLYQKKIWKLHLIVQTRYGNVIALDGDTGRRIWRTSVGKPYTVTKPVGFNNTIVVVPREGYLFGLDRKDGSPLWKIGLRGGPATAPVVDERHVYAASGTRTISTFGLEFNPTDTPRTVWKYTTVTPLEQLPALTKNYLVMPSVRGSVLIMNKNTPTVYRSFETDDLLAVPSSIHPRDSIVYIGSRDATVYAENIESGLETRPWRFLAGAPITRKLVVTDDDVYATAGTNGLFRIRRRPLSADELSKYIIDRGYISAARLAALKKTNPALMTDPRAILRTLDRRDLLTNEQLENIPWQEGQSIWQQLRADRVVSVNPKFVYVMDLRGNLKVLERERGLILSQYKMRDWVVPITNEWTDRLVFAAHNGKMICLHDRDYRKPVMTKMPLVPSAPPPPPR